MGTGIKPKEIFINGLDGCADKDAQAKAIAFFARGRSTPFSWDIFNLAGFHIIPTFIQECTHSLGLPIFHEADDEIDNVSKNIV